MPTSRPSRRRGPALLALAALAACAHGAPAPPPVAAEALGPGDVEGFVAGPQGAPVRDAIVALVRGDASRPGAVTRTDERGRFRFYGQGPGDLAITATSPAGAAAFLGGLRLDGRAPLRGARLALGADGFRVEGVVEDRAGRPFPLAQVLAARLGPARGDLFVTIADAEGRYALVLSRAPHLLLAEGDGHASRDPARASPGAPGRVDLVLDPR